MKNGNHCHWFGCFSSPRWPHINFNFSFGWFGSDWLGSIWSGLVWFRFIAFIVASICYLRENSNNANLYQCWIHIQMNFKWKLATATCHTCWQYTFSKYLIFNIPFIAQEVNYLMWLLYTVFMIERETHPFSTIYSIQLISSNKQHCEFSVHFLVNIQFSAMELNFFIFYARFFPRRIHFLFLISSWIFLATIVHFCHIPKFSTVCFLIWKVVVELIEAYKRAFPSRFYSLFSTKKNNFDPKQLFMTFYSFCLIMQRSWVIFRSSND